MLYKRSAIVGSGDLRRPPRPNDSMLNAVAQRQDNLVKSLPYLASAGAKPAL